MDVYFDYIEDGKDIKLGVVVEEDFDVILREMKTVQKGADTNFYHWTLDALEFALEFINEEEYDVAVLKNQQKLIFEWLVNDNYKESYDAYYKPVKKLMSTIVSEGGLCSYEVIKGEKNVAKKYLKKNAGVKTRNGSGSSSGDLTGLFKDTNKNVINILDKMKKQA